MSSHNITLSWNLAEIVNDNPKANRDPINIYDEEDNLVETILPEEPRYKIHGSWFNFGEYQGSVSTPCTADGTLIHSKSSIILSIESILAMEAAQQEANQ
jgi:hypothetical protein